MTLKLAQPDGFIYADQWNELIARSLSAVGPGLQLQQTPTGSILSLAFALAKYALPARITAAPTQTDPPTLMDSGVVYDAVAIGVASAKVTAKLPKYGRDGIAAGAAVQPAAVGDLCFIVRITNDDGTSTDDLWTLTERPIGAPCEG